MTPASVCSTAGAGPPSGSTPQVLPGTAPRAASTAAASVLPGVPRASASKRGPQLSAPLLYAASSMKGLTGAPLHLAVIPGYTLYKPAHVYMCSFSRWKEKIHLFSDRCVYAYRLPPAAAGICIHVCAHTCICLTAVCILPVYRVWTHVHMPGFPHSSVS